MNDRSDKIYVSVDRMTGFVKGLFKAAGISDGDATMIASMIVDQEIRGITTHGLRQIDYNLMGFAEGRMNLRLN